MSKHAHRHEYGHEYRNVCRHAPYTGVWDMCMYMQLDLCTNVYLDMPMVMYVEIGVATSSGSSSSLKA